MQPAQKKSDLLPARKSDAVLGAVLIHAVIAALFFLKGAILGQADQVVMSPVGASGPVGYGFLGGLYAIRAMLIFYIFGCGGPLLVGSLLGAFLGLMVFPALRKRGASEDGQP